VRDVEASVRFYEDVLDLHAYNLDEYRAGKSSLVSIRISETFILHLRPDPELEPAGSGGYDHLALVLENTTPETLAQHLADHGVEIERSLSNPKGAQGVGPALYVRDPDGYLIELKMYGTQG
jgi:catechol 2,3-dioxygenase-like lactoylglutathione lyase family enzyme